MNKISIVAASLITFLAPLFFLPLTNEFYATNKTAMLLAVTLLATIAWLGTSLFTRMAVINRRSLLRLVPWLTLICLTTASTLYQSSNAMQDLVTTRMSIPTLISLAVFALIISTLSASTRQKQILPLFIYSTITASLIVGLASSHVINSTNLSVPFRFLNDTFSTFGNTPDLIMTLLYAAVSVWIVKGQREVSLATKMVGLIFVLLAGVALITRGFGQLYASAAPIDYSMQLARATLASFPQALIGHGLGSFPALFPSVKNAAYNSSALWQIGTFESASFGILQILIEGGMIAVAIFFWIFWSIATHINKLDHHRMPYYTLLGLTFTYFVATPLHWYSLFLAAFLFGLTSTNPVSHQSTKPWQILLHLTVAVLVLASTLPFLNYYRAEIAARSALLALSSRNARELYIQQGRAVSLFPYAEQYRINFSQTNVLLARELAAQQKPPKDYVTQSIQTAIHESQAAVALGPKIAQNWANLGTVYKNILGVEGAELWAMSAFQRAVLLDPQNVLYRMELGGLYYSLERYTNAISVFQEVVILKPDFTNGYYNLAYSYLKNDQLDRAKTTYSRLLELLKKQHSPEYQKALQERAQFGL